MNPDRKRARLMAWLGIGFEAGLGALAWPLGWLLGVDPLQTLHADLRGLLLGVLATLPMLPLFVWCIRSSLRPLARIRTFFDEVLRPIFAGCTLAELALVAAAAGVGEEMLFRGVIQPAIGHWLGDWPGVALASALFGLVHPITPFYAILAGGLGVYLGVTSLASGNLLVPILAHALYDFIALVYLLRIAIGPATRDEPRAPVPLDAEAAGPAPTTPDQAGTGAP